MRAADEEEAYFTMADKRTLKLIGAMFAALTLMVVAVVVAGHPASSVNGEYPKLVDFRD